MGKTVKEIRRSIDLKDNSLSKQTGKCRKYERRKF
jgi:hypothetical protein